MTKYFTLFVALVAAVACGGTTDSGNGPYDNGSAGSGGGAGKGSSGSGSQAGKSSSGSGSGGTSSAGTSSAGSSSAGSAHGGVATAGAGGVSSAGVSSGGSGGVVDPRCPPTQPAPDSGGCPAQGIHCEYNPFNQCLCYDSLSGTFGACSQIDNTCTGPNSAAGAGGASPQPPPFGSGGISTKIAAPAHQVCSCSADDKWSCTLNIGI